jgi:hypothetical protein
MVVWQGRRPVYGPKRTIGDEADTVPAAGAAEHGNAVARRRWRLLSPPISLGTPARSGWTSWTIRTRSKRPRDLEPMTKLVKGCSWQSMPIRCKARRRGSVRRWLPRGGSGTAGRRGGGVPSIRSGRFWFGDRSALSNLIGDILRYGRAGARLGATDRRFG